VEKYKKSDFGHSTFTHRCRGAILTFFRRSGARTPSRISVRYSIWACPGSARVVWQRRFGGGTLPLPPGGRLHRGRGNFFSRTATATDSPTTSICRASMPHIPKWFARAVAPTVSEIGAPKVFRPVRYIAEGKKIRRGDPNFFDWNVCRSHWGTSSRNSVNKILKIGELGGIL
jgi:hypothetical protein